MAAANRSVVLKAMNFAALTVILLLSGCLKTPWHYHQAGIHMNLGMAYIESYQYTPALKELLEAEKLTPDDARIHFYIGIAYQGKGLNDHAVGAFKKAVSLKPDYSDAHNNLGIAYMSTGKPDMAITAFERALANIVYATPANALNNMGLAYYQKGEYETALRQYQEALKREPNTVLAPVIFLNMGLANIKMNRHDEAMRHLRRALAAVPEYAEARYWMAECLAIKRDFVEAKNQFQAIVAAAPESEFGLKAQSRLKDIGEMK